MVFRSEHCGLPNQLAGSLIQRGAPGWWWSEEAPEEHKPGMEGHSVLPGAQMQPSAQSKECAQQIIYLHQMDSIHRTRVYLKRGP